jgi:uncharacterized membrane protein
MTKKHILVSYLVTLIVLVATDFVWLSMMADRLYKPVLGEMLTTEFRLFPAVVFYLIYAAGLVYLAVRPGLLLRSLRSSTISGAVLGFTAYATYDLTNQATLVNWSTTLTISDLLWGTVLSATACSAGYWFTNKWIGSTAVADQIVG